MMEEEIASGPYRATILWNTLLRAFRTGLPLSKHRRFMKTYEGCFVASDAVEWIHKYLKKNPNFGADVTRDQAVRLLQKLYAAGEFEDVRGPKYNNGEFTNNWRLFRPTVTTPSRVLRTPLALRHNTVKQANMQTSPLIQRSLPQPIQVGFETKATAPFEEMLSALSLSGKVTTLPECHFISRPLTTEEIEQLWKETIFESLQKILGVDGLDDLIDSNRVSGKYIRHNCLYINKSGVVTNIDPQEQSPHWALSAMKCLAYWPNKIVKDLPNYPGFKKDVFQAVKDYFCGLPEPLMTYNMYDVISNIFECQDASALEVSASGQVLNLSPIHPTVNSSTNRITEDVHSVMIYETAFQPDIKTTTRKFYRDTVATNICQLLRDTEQTRRSVETKFIESCTCSKPCSCHRKSSVQCSKHSRRPSVTKRHCGYYKACDNSRHGCEGQFCNETCMCGYTEGCHAKFNIVASQSSTSKSEPVAESYLCGDEHGQWNGRCYVNSKSSMSAMQPSCNSSFPDSVYPVSVQPVLDVSKSLRKESVSSSSLSHSQLSVQTSCSKRGKSSVSDGIQRNGKDAIATRSSSLSDLALTVPPLENELQNQRAGKTLQLDQCVDFDDGTEKMVKTLQLMCLLLPPTNRRRLHLLLRLMHKISTNEQLVLDETQDSRSLLLETFSQAILSCEDESKMDNILVIQVVTFLMDNYKAIFMVPTDLKCIAETRIENVQRTKVTKLNLKTHRYHHVDLA